MKIGRSFVLLTLLSLLTLALQGCASKHSPASAITSAITQTPTEQAERILDAFYAYDMQALSNRLPTNADSDRLLYYQAWAEAAHYAVKTRRPCQLQTGNKVQCAITVTDDFGTAMGYTATDTFTFGFSDNHQLQSIAFEGDDPPIMQELQAWIGKTRPNILSGPCHRWFDGGTTPAACAKAVAQAANDFMQQAK